jgi:hypothetical protein
MALIFRRKKIWAEVKAEIETRQRAELEESMPAQCDHKRIEPRRYPIANGRVQLRNQCLDCGELVGSALRYDSVPNVEALPVVNEIARQRTQNRWQDRQEVAERHRRERDSAFWAYYDAHLNSQEWREKCRLKRERAEHVCEGCGLNKVNHIHHLTYDNLGDELLFELVALCVECHQKIHPHREIA